MSKVVIPKSNCTKVVEEDSVCDERKEYNK